MIVPGELLLRRGFRRELELEELILLVLVLAVVVMIEGCRLLSLVRS
jgi:hypothetical protein